MQDLKKQYFSQNLSLALDALRVGYYLIEKVSEITIVDNKQMATASAYWSPDSPTFNPSLATKVNLKALGNYYSSGPKELDYKKFELEVLQITSVEFFKSDNENYTPTYKIEWQLLGPYSGDKVTPTFFRDEQLESRWYQWANHQQQQEELYFLDQPDEDMQMMLALELEADEAFRELNAMISEASQEDQEQLNAELYHDNFQDQSFDGCDDEFFDNEDAASN